jgi:hypothetical protein
MAAPDWNDWHAITTALIQLGAILDARDWDRVGEVVAADAVAYGETGLESIVNANLRRYLGGCGVSQHLLGNYEIDVDGDRATSRCLVRAYHRGAGERIGSWFETYGAYRDGWRRDPDGWRMTSRELDVIVNVGDISVLQPG